MKKQKMTKKFRKENSKGITLIALVVTIIVLLILAGISIMMLTGNQGILTKAGEASNRTRKETAREQIIVEVLGSYNNIGEIDTEKLKDQLQTNVGADTRRSTYMSEDPLSAGLNASGADPV